MKILLPSCLLLLLLGSVITACKHTRYTASNLPENRLQWGSGGGFLGKESYFILLDNGQIFKHEAMMGDSIAEIKGVKHRVAKSIFKAADEAGITALDFNYPANTYMFINHSGKRVAWGDKNHPVGEPVDNLYHQLNDLIKK